MALVSISQAAKLAGKSRSTLYRTYIDTGKLSVQKDATGKAVVDTSELLRVFGDIGVADATANATAQSDTSLQNATPQKDSEISLLRELLKAKDEQLSEAKEREEWMRKQVDDLMLSVKLIQDKSEKKQPWYKLKLF
jgi:hypothetical protein